MDRDRRMNRTGLIRWGAVVACLLVLAGGALWLWGQTTRAEARIGRLEREVKALSAEPATTRPSIDGLDLVASVEGFYDRAWAKIIAVVGLAGIVVGVVVPLVVQQLQHSSFRDSEDRLRKEWNESVSDITADLGKKTDAAMDMIFNSAGVMFLRLSEVWLKLDERSGKGRESLTAWLCACWGALEIAKQRLERNSQAIESLGSLLQTAWGRMGEDERTGVRNSLLSLENALRGKEWCAPAYERVLSMLKEIPAPGGRA